MPAFATMPSMILYQGNTQEVLVQGVMDSDSNLFVNNATLNLTVLDQNRNEMIGTVAMAYVAASNGNYVGVINVPFSKPIGSGYTVVVDGDAVNSHLHLEVPATIVVRTM